ncbi:MAG TPA: MFS transporter [Trebonia sp.]|nr:MFS transporter [Trebonia sp.]
MSAPPAARHASQFRHPVAFWLGVAACAVGVGLHLPMYYSARSMGYQMNGMHPDAAMIIGMVAIGAGLATGLYGLMPAGAGAVSQRAARIRVRAMDDAPVNWRHVALLVAMALAITIDVMKPTTLSFVTPGMAREYGLKSAITPHGTLPVALLPLCGIGGTVGGSLLWGWLGDRIGRRASIIFAGLLFVTTSICGAMPGFTWNMLMCFLMGIGAGGMLPIAFALMAETIPARHRGWLMVLIGGDVAGAYVITSWLAGALTPEYSWRILWLIGLPTGLLFIGLNRWIPESPRYLLATGQREEAAEIMRKFGSEVVPGSDEDEADASVGTSGLLRVSVTRLPGPSTAIVILAIGVGFVTYGFQQWIPTNLQHLGYTSVNSDYIIRNAAVIGLPLTFVVAWMYGFWSSRKTIIVVCGCTVVSLVWIAAAGNSLASDHALLTGLLVVPIAGISSAAAVVTAYAAEIYPTMVRSRGVGLAAGMTKVGGVLIIALVVVSATTPSIAATALIGAVPLLAGIIVLGFARLETRQRPLEEITQAEFSLSEQA